MVNGARISGIRGTRNAQYAGGICRNCVRALYSIVRKNHGEKIRAGKRNRSFALYRKGDKKSFRGIEIIFPFFCKSFQVKKVIKLFMRSSSRRSEILVKERS